MRRWFMIIIIAFMIEVLLTGCGNIELEHKEFPLAIGLDIENGQFQVIYDIPDLSKATDQSGEKKEKNAFQVQVGTIQSAQEEYQKNTDKQLDYSHVKSIIMSQRFFEQKELLESFLEYLEGNNEISQSVMIFISESPKNVIDKGSEKEGGLGLYLDKLMSNKIKEEQKINVGNLLSHWRNQNEVLIIPTLKEKGKMDIQMKKGIILKNLTVKGELQEEEKEILFLSQGKTIDKIFYLKDKPEITVHKASVSYQIEKISNIPTVSVRLILKGEVNENTVEKKSDIDATKKIIKDQIHTELKLLEERINQNEKIDLWNTFIMLGSKNRGLWKEFHNNQEVYEQIRKIQFTVDWSGI